jgi:hypothetical protein
MSSNKVIFVSGERVEYNLSQEEQELLLTVIQKAGYHELSEGVYWVPDLDSLEKAVHLVTK